MERKNVQTDMISGTRTRREFLKSGAATGVAASVLGLSSAASYAQIVGANERIGTGFIGVGNRGESLLKSVLASSPGAKAVAVADVYQPYLENARALIGANAAGYSDYRKLLENKDVEAVVIATPDHWHALQFIDASDAGKDVYVEKPLSLVVSEGRAMVRAAEKNRIVSQMGAQRHSSAYIVEACKLMREGIIGKITHVRCFHLANESPMGIGKKLVAPVPEGLDWDMWLGPAPKIEFQEVVWNYKFRWFWDYSGGQMTNFGTHWIDVIQMAIGEDAPVSVSALGGKFAVEDDRDIPDTMEAIWQYKNCLVTFSQVNANRAPGGKDNAEMIFRGTHGTLYIYNNRYVIETEEMQDGPYPARGPLNRNAEPPTKKGTEPKSVSGKVDHDGHLNNFFDCVKSRAKCACDVETGHHSSTTTLIANIALRTESVLKWDRESEKFINNDAANRLLAYQYRSPWNLRYS